MATTEQIGRAMKAAEAAGDSEAVKKLIPAYKAAQQAETAAPTEPEAVGYRRADQPTPDAPAAPAAPPVSRGYDVLRSVGTGLRSAAEHGVGFFGDIGDLGTAAGEKVSGWLGITPEERAAAQAARTSGPLGFTQKLPGPPSGEDISQNVTTPAIGEHYQPQTKVGEKARDLSEFAGGMVGGPANLLTRFGTRVVAPWLGSEGGSQLAKATGLEDYEPALRFLGAVAVGGAAAGTERGAIGDAAKKIGENPQALARFQALLKQSGMTEEQILAKQNELGILANPMDVSKPMAWQGGRIVAKGGEPGVTVANALEERYKGGNQRINETLEKVGPNEDPSQVRKEFSQRAKDIGEEYPAAHAAQKQPVDTQSIADELDTELANARGSRKPTLQAIRDSLNIPGGDPLKPDTMALDPSTNGLHNARKDIGNMLYDADGNIRPNLGTEEAGALKYYYGKITDALHEASDPFKDVDTRYSGVKKEGAAYEQGRSLLDSKRETPTPGDVNRQIEKGGPAVKTALSRGALTDLYRIVGQNANDRVALQNVVKGAGDWNRDKLTSLFGEEKAKAIFDVLEREKVFSETKNAVTGGSPTASRQAEEMGPFSGLSWSDAIKVGGLSAIPRALAMRVVDSISEKMSTGRIEARDASLANMLSGKTNRAELAKALLKARTGPSRLKGPLLGGVLSQNKEEKR